MCSYIYTMSVYWLFNAVDGYKRQREHDKVYVLCIIRFYVSHMQHMGNMAPLCVKGVI